MSINANWSRENLAWAAGLFEGEGNIYPPQNKLSISMTDKDTIERFREVVGVGTVKAVTTPSRPTHWKQQWIWQCNKQQHTQAILAAFWNWLGSRRRAKAEEFFYRMANAYKARIHYGSDNYKAKLSESQVVEVLTSNDSASVLAKRFGVTPTNIYDIRKRKTWRHVDVARHLLGTSPSSPE